MACAPAAAQTSSVQNSPTRNSKKSSAKKTKTTSDKPTGTHARSAKSHNKKSAPPAPGSSKSKKHKKSAKGRHRGQSKIDGDRTRQIQEALIREHYLSGEPSGEWDTATQRALERYQAENGWQSKTVPDSRALIKLGLGPSRDHLLNPESAMTTAVSSPANPSREPLPSSASAPGPGDPPKN